MVILDFDRRITEINPAAERLLEVSRQQVLGQHIDRLESPLGRQLTALSEGGTGIVALSGPRRLRCHHGTFVDRGFRRSFLVVEELTEEVRRFERAAYEKIIRVMSHEVNNSITATNSLLESSLTYTAELSTANRVDLEQALHIAIDRSAQLNLFMRRFADVFRLPPPVRQAVDLRDLLEALVTLLRPRFSGVSVGYNWTDGSPPAWCSADRGQLEQAFLNILKNAVEAAGEGGAVAVHLTFSDGSIRVAVDDSGPGPGLEAEAHLVTPFFSTKPHGQGVGLTLVQEIFSAHGFGYSLEHPPGGPTRFSAEIAPDIRTGSGSSLSA
jgi:signal transduction histidine kinase